MKVLVLATSLVFSAIGNVAFAKDISGMWKILMIKQDHQKRS